MPTAIRVKRRGVGEVSPLASMPRSVVRTPRYHVPVENFSIAVTAPASGSQVYLASVPADVEAAFVAQARSVLDGVGDALRQLGGTFDDVVRIVVYLLRMEDYGTLFPLLVDCFGAAPPASACVEVAALPVAGQPLALDAIAVIEA